MHKLLLFCLLYFVLTGCCGLKTQEKSGYSEISRIELQEEIASSVMGGYRGREFTLPRWRYAGSDADYHYIFYYYISYFHFNLPPTSGAEFYKIRKDDLTISVEDPFSPELAQAREVFRRLSSFSKLPFREQHELQMEKGYTLGHVDKIANFAEQGAFRPKIRFLDSANLDLPRLGARILVSKITLGCSFHILSTRPRDVTL